MCGINGLISRKAIDNAEDRVEQMNLSLQHRGPNAEGKIKLNAGKVILGHRRLSIIDLDSRSNQPMISLTKKSVIVYNGEIYNYNELKKYIKYDFITNSDTEVLLAGLEANGIEWLDNCNGMFAFAYYDAIKKNVVLARDRLGIKPLYYYADDNVFVFSSEIKGILNSGLVKAEFNYDAIDEYLGYRYVREPYTFFKNIYQVPAGCYLVVDESLKYKLYQYWELPNEFNKNSKYDENEVYQEFKTEVIKAIRRRLVSDVELGTYLSGGIDSSIISAITALNANRKVNTYTIGFSELNEFEYAELVAKKYDTNHHSLLMNLDNYFSLMNELINFKDAPLGVPNEIPLAVMSKKLKEKITVVLSGEGADELMGGYGKIFRSPFDYKHVDRNCHKDFYNYFIDKYEYVPRDVRDKYLCVSIPLRKEYDEKIKSDFEKRDNEENVFRFFHKYHVKGLLQRVDMTTMYASVEARVPFLDHQLIEFTYKKVPYELKLKWKSCETMTKAMKYHSSEYSENYDEPKYLLKRMGLDLLPHEVVTRKKMGFPVPLNEWFDNLSDIANSLLRNCDWIYSEKLQELIAECRNNSRSGQLLWMFINIEMFKKNFFKKEWRY